MCTWKYVKNFILIFLKNTKKAQFPVAYTKRLQKLNL